MTPGGRLAAAIEVFADIEARHRPAAEALKDYGLAHRFAGSKDRAAVAAYVFDALRRRASSAWLMGAETPRAIVLGALSRARGLDVEAIAALCDGEAHAPEPLSEQERAALTAQDFSAASPAVLGDFPEWLSESLAAVFPDTLAVEMQAMAARAPLDIRVNTLRSTREKAMNALSHLDPAPALYAPQGLRLPLGPDGRGPALSGEPAFIKGLVEVQDEGSQLAAILAGAKPGEQVLDLCAGGGGKTLALAAMMDNRGQIYASDTEGRRLMGLYPRLGKSGARNVQLRAPRRGVPPLDDLKGRCDLVLVDAPCTGTGTWRRNPDAKWRVRPGALEQRIKEQDEVLQQAALYVKPGGRIVYVTCSLLQEENEARVAHFLGSRDDFVLRPPQEVAKAAGLEVLVPFADPSGTGLRLSPLRTGTDGFFIAELDHVAKKP
ncbi:MAG: RsmB/NOP family class I SAM-dependent RNA methyltransferase [Beijerinckiaceae bacterium]|jgi:16S rRNA (cytosine967-C5)-methyltransferase